MKRFFIVILVCTVGYLLYDKFITSDSETVVSIRSMIQDWIGGFSSSDEEDVFAPSPMKPNTKNYSLAKMEHPETMTDEERRMAENWENEKSQYFAELDRMKSVYRTKVKVPYRYNQRFAEKLKTAIIELDTAINYDDFLIVPGKRDAAIDALRRFESGCVWQAGVSRGRGTHMHSGYTEGRWEPDNGYTMVNRGGELVAMQVTSCRECHGTGSVIQRVTCSNCNGRGRVANPLAQVGNVANMVGAFMGGKGRRQISRLPNQPQEIPCTACNRGQIDQRIPCPGCGGSGKIFR